MKFIVLFVFLIALFGCAGTPETEKAKLELPTSFYDSRSWSESDKSSLEVYLKEFGYIAAVEAKFNPSPSFKYGRFCGEGHPGLSEKLVESKNFQKNSETISKLYFSYSPVDDIDAACQRHDVCWALNPKLKFACNEIFEEELDTIQKKFRLQIGFWGSASSRQGRCESLARDISFVSSAVMKASIQDDGLRVRHAIGKVVTFPISLIYSGLSLVFGWGSYPEAGDWCRLSTSLDI